MTYKEIEERIAHIHATRDDYEHAHGEEDKLYHDFTKHVAENADDDMALADKARLILSTERIEFARYCA